MRALTLAAILLLLSRDRQTRELPRYREPFVYTQKDWNLADWPDVNCRAFCRFNKAELSELADLLDIGAITFSNRLRPSPELALAITLNRLHYPATWRSRCEIFGRSIGYLSTVFTEVILHLDTTYAALLDWHPRLDDEQLLEYFAQHVEAIHELKGIWGFIDGTFRGFRRPGIDQQRWYSGHYKMHGFKYQGVVTPDGILSSLSGPWRGPVSDWKGFLDSIVVQKARRMNRRRRQRGTRLYLYGDAAYGLQHAGILGPHKRQALGCLTPSQQIFNRKCSRMRISIEHAFGHVQRQFTYTDFHQGLSLGLQPVASFYRVSALFANLLTCYRGNQTSQTFDCNPPTVYEYLQIE